jgi:hypothetical protein
MDKDGFVTEFGKEILERVVKTEVMVKNLNDKIDKYNGLRDKLDSTANTANNCEKAIAAIIESSKWSRRLAIGAVVTTVGAVIGGLIINKII